MAVRRRADYDVAGIGVGVGAGRDPRINRLKRFGAFQ